MTPRPVRGAAGRPRRLLLRASEVRARSSPLPGPLASFGDPTQFTPFCTAHTHMAELCCVLLYACRVNHGSYAGVSAGPSESLSLCCRGAMPQLRRGGVWRRPKGLAGPRRFGGPPFADAMLSQHCHSLVALPPLSVHSFLPRHHCDAWGAACCRRGPGQRRGRRRGRRRRRCSHRRRCACPAVAVSL